MFGCESWLDGGVVRLGVRVGLDGGVVRSGVRVGLGAGVVVLGVVSEGTRCDILFIRLFVMVFEYIVIKKM